jgi:hypothetical protein
MPIYKVTHLVLCEVATYRTIEAKDGAELLEKIASIETLTCSDDNFYCDYEIVADREAIEVDIKEITRG